MKYLTINTMKWKKLFVLSYVFLLISNHCFSQNVVISEYYNSDNATNEWIELLVINDNSDLRNYTIRDNNATHNNWDNTPPNVPITFNNISLWNNLRAGTIIIIWLRSNSPLTYDTMKNDGYIETQAQLSSQFTYSGSSFDIAGSGEIIQIRTPNKTHIHALAHRSTPGIDFTDSIPSLNKLNHSSSSATGKATYVSPGSNISDYLDYGSGIFSGNTLTNVDSDTTRGLPNSTNISNANRNYWRNLRQPPYTGLTLNTPVDSFAYNKVHLSWTTSGWTDPNPSDLTVGFLILRNTSNSFTDPSDSLVYTIGATLGSATVVSNINSSTTLAYTDNFTFTCGTTYYYKIYAFRFSADNNNISNAARGRAYNETGTNVQSIIKNSPIAQTIIPN